MWLLCSGSSAGERGVCSISMQICQRTTGLLPWHRPPPESQELDVCIQTQMRALTSIKLLPWIWHSHTWMLVPESHWRTVALFWERCASVDAWLRTLLSAFHPKFHLFSGPHFLSLPGSLQEGESLSSPSNSLLPGMLVFHFLSCILLSDPRKAGTCAKLPSWPEEVYSVMPLMQGACPALEEPSDGSCSQRCYVDSEETSCRNPFWNS